MGYVLIAVFVLAVWLLTTYPLLAAAGVVGAAVLVLIVRELRPAAGAVAWAPPTSGRRGARTGELTRANDVIVAELDPAWPVVPPPPHVKRRRVDKSTMAYVREDCPTCGAAFTKLPKAKSRCRTCGAEVLVRVGDDDRLHLLSATELEGFERLQAERREAAWKLAERDWHAAVAAAGVLVDGEDGVELDVVGESHRHADLASLRAAIFANPEDRDAMTVARLIREPDNKYDRNAVRVEIHSRLVGYLSREDAADIRSWIEQLERRGPIYVLARMVGGQRQLDGRVGPIGVQLVDVPDPFA